VEKLGANAAKIKGLEGIDMTSLSDKKLEPFFEFCKKNDVGIKADKNIDRQTPAFWSGVFTGGPKVEMNIKKGETTERAPLPTIDSEKTDPRITDAESLMKALNALSGTKTSIPEEKKAEKEGEKKAQEPVDTTDYKPLAAMLTATPDEKLFKDLKSSDLYGKGEKLGKQIGKLVKENPGLHAALYGFVGIIESLRKNQKMPQVLDSLGANEQDVSFKQLWEDRERIIALQYGKSVAEIQSLA